MIQSTATADGDNMQLYTPDSEYYWDFLTFLIGSRLFRLPKRRFAEGSEKFCKDYNVEEKVLGADDAGQVRITLDVDVTDFQNFLKALYPQARDGSVNLSKEGWISVLNLSTKWFFNDLREMAITKLAEFSMTAIERICLAKEYNISLMLLSGYSDIIDEQRCISVEEAAQMDPDKGTAIGLYQIIVRRLQGLWSGFGQSDIEEVFSEELKRVRFAEEQYLTSEGRARIAAEKARVENEERVRKEVEEERARAEEEEKVSKAEEEERARKAEEEEKAKKSEEEERAREVEEEKVRKAEKKEKARKAEAEKARKAETDERERIERVMQERIPLAQRLSQVQARGETTSGAWAFPKRNSEAKAKNWSESGWATWGS